MSSYRTKVLAQGSIPPGDAPKSKHQRKAEKQAMRTLSNATKTVARKAQMQAALDAYAPLTPAVVAAAPSSPTAAAPSVPQARQVTVAASPREPEITPAPLEAAPAAAAPQAPATDIARGHSIMLVAPQDTIVQPRRTWLQALHGVWASVVRGARSAATWTQAKARQVKEAATPAALWVQAKALLLKDSVQSYFAQRDEA